LISIVSAPHSKVSGCRWRPCLDPLAEAAPCIERLQSCSQLGLEFRRRWHLGPGEHGNERKVLAAHHDVRDQRRERFEELCAQFSGGNPRARAELEILGHATCKAQSLLDVCRIVELRGVAGTVEPFFVEDAPIHLRVGQVTGRDDLAADTHLIAWSVRHQLERHAGHR
jgi:hypothetical protein